MNITNFLSFDFSFFKTPLGIILIVLAIVLILCILILLIGGKKKGDDSHEELAPENDLNQDNIEVPSATEQMQMMASDAVKEELKDVQENVAPDVFIAPAPAETAAEKAANYESIKEEQTYAEPTISEREVVPAVNQDEEAPAMVKAEEKQDNLSNRAPEPAPYGGLDPAANINFDFAQEKTPYGGVDPQHGTQQLSPKFFEDVREKEKEDEVMMPQIMGMNEENTPSVEPLPNAEVNSVNPYQMPAEAGSYNRPSYVNEVNNNIAEVPSMPHEEVFPSNEVNTVNNSQVDFYNTYDNLYERTPEENNMAPVNNNPYPASDSFYAEPAVHPVDNLNPYGAPGTVNNSQADYYNVNSTNNNTPSVNETPQVNQNNNTTSYDPYSNDIETL